MSSLHAMRPEVVGWALELQRVIRESPDQPFRLVRALSADGLTEIRVTANQVEWRARGDHKTRWQTLDHRHGSSGPTVAFLLEDAEAANGKTFEGYKGGDYTMDIATAVWADEWGESEGRMLLGARVSDGEVVLQTFVRPPEYA